MPDITMCENHMCPKKRQCYRAIATPSDYQSVAFFGYTVGANGVECENYMPVWEISER